MIEVRFLFKMSAAFASRLPAKDVYNFVVRFNIFQILLLLLIIIPTLNSKTPLDLVSNCLNACKILSLTLLFLNVCVGFSTVQKTAVVKTFQYRIKNALKGAVLYLISAIFFHVVAVLYGAPFLHSVPETFHFGLMLSSTAVLPCLFVLGLNLANWIRVFAQNSPELGPESVVQITSICSIVGAWFGAFPIPLDWDRPWQVWPITCVLGTLAGYIIGLILGTAHLCVKYNYLKKFKIT